MMDSAFRFSFWQCFVTSNSKMHCAIHLLSFYWAFKVLGHRIRSESKLCNGGRIKIAFSFLRLQNSKKVLLISTFDSFYFSIFYGEFKRAGGNISHPIKNQGPVCTIFYYCKAGLSCWEVAYLSFFQEVSIIR